MAVNTGKIQGKHREFNLNLNVATLMKFVLDFCHRLSIGKNPVQISWSETNLKTL